jgi:hypothetical protein
VELDGAELVLAVAITFAGAREAHAHGEVAGEPEEVEAVRDELVVEHRRVHCSPRSPPGRLPPSAPPRSQRVRHARVHLPQLELRHVVPHLPDLHLRKPPVLTLKLLGEIGGVV